MRINGWTLALTAIGVAGVVAAIALFPQAAAMETGRHAVIAISSGLLGMQALYGAYKEATRPELSLEVLQNIKEGILTSQGIELEPLITVEKEHTHTQMQQPKRSDDKSWEQFVSEQDRSRDLTV